MRDATVGDRGSQPSFDSANKLGFADWNFRLKAFVGNWNWRALSGTNQVERGQEPLQYDTYDGERRQQAVAALAARRWASRERSATRIGSKRKRRLADHRSPRNIGSAPARLINVLEFDLWTEPDLPDESTK